MSGILYLLPTPLGPETVNWLLPDCVAKIRPIVYFVVEAEKTARKHLKLLQLDHPIQQLSMSVLDEHTDPQTVQQMLVPALAGHDMVLMSEAGCPAVADPGARLVAEAHQKGVRVIPLVGASSILLALMASGANGQHFTFLGYLPADSSARKNSIKKLQQRAQNQNETQIFIETPYRNDAMFTDLIATLSDTTQLCIAADITQSSEWIFSAPVSHWKKRPAPELKKRPCIFIVF